MYAAAAIVFSCGVFLLFWFGVPYLFHFRFLSPQAPFSADQAGAAACGFRRALDGICVEREEDTMPRVVGVMVENNFEAWPISGMSKASVIYEAPAEGNIPRFFALYIKDAEAEQVGPVRSARPYFVDWAGEIPGLMYMHVGGSPEALREIDRQEVFHVDGITRGWYYWRDEENRKAPHNTYTSARLWQKAFDAYGSASATGTTDAWLFDDREPCSDACVTSTTIRYGIGGYSVIWRYNGDTGKYERYQAKDDEPDRDIDGTIIAADTVIVQYVSAVVLDEVGRLRIDTMGEGEAVVFRDGFMTEGIWRKPSRGVRTQWVHADGNSIALKGGTIWVEVVPR